MYVFLLTSKKRALNSKKSCTLHVPKAAQNSGHFWPTPYQRLGDVESLHGRGHPVRMPCGEEIGAEALEDNSRPTLGVISKKRFKAIGNNNVCTALWIPLLKRTHVRAKLKYGKEHLEQTAPGREFCGVTRWRLDFFRCNCGTHLWIKKGEALNARCAKSALRSEGWSVMLWGCCSALNLGSLSGSTRPRLFCSVLTRECTTRVLAWKDLNCQVGCFAWDSYWLRKIQGIVWPLQLKFWSAKWVHLNKFTPNGPFCCARLSILN